MKTTALLALSIIAIVLLLWLALHRNKPLLNAKGVPSDNQVVTNESAALNSKDQNSSVSNEIELPRPLGIDDDGWRYLKMTRQLALNRNQPVQFHAKITDQFGQPVGGANLKLTLTYLDEEMFKSTNFYHKNMGDEIRNKPIELTSDAQGLIHVFQERGYVLDIRELSKDGYLWQRPDGLGAIEYEPNARHTDSGKIILDDALDPLKGFNFHLWKKGQLEKLVKVNCSVPIEPYGTNWYAANLLTGRVNDFQDADILFWFETTSDASGNPARNFRYQIVNGGLVLDTSSYPYHAPANGYEPEWDWYYEPFGKNAKDDLPALMKKNFYIKIRGGKMYGAITWHWGSENGVGISGYLNPTGSRNLEPDSTKLIVDSAEIRQIDEATHVK